MTSNDATDDSYSSYAASFAGHGHLMREAIGMHSRQINQPPISQAD